MSDQTISPDILDQLAEAIARHTARRIPLAVDLWSNAEIAAYLKCEPRQVSERYSCLPGFPRAIRIGGKGHPRYRAAEVIGWAEGQREMAK
jgi:hypothetical protein